MTGSLASVRWSTAIATLVVVLQSTLPSAAETFAVRANDVLAQQPSGDGSAGLVVIVSRGAAARQARMRRCMQSWGPATQMSKREWRNTCRRVIIQQPYMFGPDPL
jgi:hypothetical protein